MYILVIMVPEEGVQNAKRNRERYGEKYYITRMS